MNNMSQCSCQADQAAREDDQHCRSILSFILFIYFFIDIHSSIEKGNRGYKGDSQTFSLKNMQICKRERR